MLQGKMAGYMDVLQHEPELAAIYPGCGCDGKLLPRTCLEQGDGQPAVHFGLITSGDTVMKSGEDRDDIARQAGVMGFEMEGAGPKEQGVAAVRGGDGDSIHEGIFRLLGAFGTRISSSPRAAYRTLVKTQIALAYTYWLRRTRPEVSVFWVHASNAERFRQAYASIAQECQVPDYDDPKADVLLLVKAWLKRKDCGQWLMVIDNADDMQLFFGQHMGLGQYLPECPHGATLVTTRNKQAGLRLTRGKRPIEVGKINEDETDQLLCTHLDGISITSSESSALSYRLEHLPLALYLELLDSSDQELVDLLSEEFETDGRESETPRAVAETWILSFEQIERLFDRQAIPLEFLSRYRKQQDQEQTGPIQLTKALGVLKAFPFILVTRKWLVKKGRMRHFAGQDEALCRAGTVGGVQVYPYGCREDRAICSALLPHMYAVLGFEHIETKDERLARATLFHHAGGFFSYQGHWKDAEKFRLQARGLRREVLGEEHPSTLTCMANLASTKRVLGEEHPLTLTSMANLASTYWKQGRWKEAEELHVKELDICSMMLGEEQPDTLTSMANLSHTRKSQDRFDDALDLMKICFHHQQQVLGRDHPHTVSTLSFLTEWQAHNGNTGA
ncbi:hypothetical protein N657DRAFT_664840 [Parathielavia appendiculata]|uniref:Kinesin light chain n=1 Tax=Parathielavia appendiculata TaxID=2587402 RepID=A0AAN6Z258_9PEZI|nr:hypothetical protein N657DRAFT_664840 [Parathielavia appendiculata]